MIQSIEMQIMVHSQFCLGQTAVTGERLEFFYLFSRLKHLVEDISVYEQLKSQPHSGHESDRIKNVVITPGSFITAEPVFKLMITVEACAIHHTVKQLTMTLNVC